MLMPAQTRPPAEASLACGRRFVGVPDVGLRVVRGATVKAPDTKVDRLQARRVLRVGAVELSEVGRELLDLGRHVVVLALDVGIALEGSEFLVLQPELIRLRDDVDRERLVGLDEVAAPAFEHRQDLARRGHLVEAGEPEWVVPGLPHGAVAVVHGAGGGVLPPNWSPVYRPQSPRYFVTQSGTGSTLTGDQALVWPGPIERPSPRA